jgi:thiamine kinase-like enzyme
MADLDGIVKRLSGALGTIDGSPVPLKGGITNRNYRATFGGRQCVLRLTGKDTALLGINREAERLASERAAGLGIAPALLAAGDGYLVTEYLDAEPIEGDRLRAAPRSAAAALRAFHDSGVRLPTRFWVPELLDSYADAVRERGGTLTAEYEQARALAHRIAATLPLDDPVSCHDDLLPANILATRDRPDRAILVDWEYAGMGHRMFDLGNLAVNNDFDEAAQERALEAYFGRPPTDGRRAALALMRIMSDAREAAWGVIQGVISELEFDFDGYAREHFARMRRSAADARLNDWLDAAKP